MWQMEFNLRVGRGRLAEVLGEAAVDIDVFFLTLGLYNKSVAALDHLDSSVLEILQAYCDVRPSHVELRNCHILMI